MKSYAITQFGQPIEAIETETPAPGDAEVLLRIDGCGVCHSDIHVWEGFFDLGDGRKADLSRGCTLPLTLGHEIVGTVEHVGSGADAAVGDKAVVYPWIGCGECHVCKSGEEQNCPRPRNLGVHVNGGYATHVTVPHARYLVAYGDVPAQLAATYACSGLTAYGALKKVEQAVSGKHVLIIGAGGVGLAGVMVAQAMLDAEIIVADIDPAKLDAALAAGAHRVINPNDDGARKEIIKLTGGGAPGAIDFVGSGESVTFGFSALAHSGALVVVGLFGGAATFSVPLFPLKNLTVQGSYVGSLADLRALVTLAREGRLKPLPVTTRPLDNADETLRDLMSGKIIGRVVLTPDQQ